MLGGESWWFSVRTSAEKFPQRDRAGKCKSSEPKEILLHLMFCLRFRFEIVPF